jgi:uncharacterized membrane protein
VNWQQVTLCVIMVGGSLIALSLKSENLAMVLAGAAAGYLVQKKDSQ